MPLFVRITALFRRYRTRINAAYACLFSGAGMALLIPRLNGKIKMLYGY